MTRRLTLVVTLAVAAILAVATAGELARAPHHSGSSRHRGTVSSSSGSTDTPGWWNSPWASMMGPGGMMRPGGRYSAAVDEPQYLAEMITHHQEAVAAARQLPRSDHPELRTFGESIVKSQTAQLRQMQGWLRDWYPEATPTVDYQPMMRDLSALSGADLDYTFLHDMIGHHMAAVMLSQELLWQGSAHGQVAQLARTIRDDQHVEIVQMQRWLGQWFGTQEGPRRPDGWPACGDAGRDHRPLMPHELADEPHLRTRPGCDGTTEH